jgi:hypothetical protein
MRNAKGKQKIKKAPMSLFESLFDTFQLTLYKLYRSGFTPLRALPMQGEAYIITNGK